MKPNLPVAGLCLLALLSVAQARADDCLDASAGCVVDARDIEALPDDAVDAPEEREADSGEPGIAEVTDDSAEEAGEEGDTGAGGDPGLPD